MVVKKLTCKKCGCKHFRIVIGDSTLKSAGLQCVQCDAVVDSCVVHQLEEWNLS